MDLASARAKKMSTLVERSSFEKDSQGMKSAKEKEVIRKIRAHLKNASAKNKSRLRRKTSSATRRLQKSSLLKSYSSTELSLCERTLHYNNRQLARVLQKCRQEGRLLQDQIVDLNHQKLDLEIKQADLNCQLFQRQQRIAQQDKLISKLGCKFMEVAEILQHSGYDGADNESLLIDNNTSNNRVSLKETSPSKTPANLFQATAVSNVKDDFFSVNNRRRPPRLSNPFDLSVIAEGSDKSPNESVCLSDLAPMKESGIPASLSQIDSGKSRRETFVIHSSKQILDLPSPVKNLRPKLRMRRSERFEPMLRLSESPEKPAEVNDGNETIHSPVEMEFTSVLHSLITSCRPDGSTLLNAELPLADNIISKINQVKEPDFTFQIKDIPKAVIPAVISDGNVSCMEDESNHCITNFEEGMHLKEDNKNFKFVTERLSNKGGKRSTASARSSPESTGHLPDSISYQPEECLNMKKCEMVAIDDMPAVKLEANDHLKMVNPNEKNTLPLSIRRVSFSDMEMPLKRKSEKLKADRKKRSAATKTSTFKNDDGDLPVMQSPSRQTRDLLPTRFDCPSNNEGNFPVLESILIHKTSKLSLKKRPSKSTSKVGNSDKDTHPHIPERSVLGEMSPNRLGLKPMDNNSSSIGKPYLKNVQKCSEEAMQDLQEDVEITGRSRRTRGPVSYKLPSLTKKLRRD